MMRLPKTGGRNLLTGSACPLHTDHNDFEIDRPENLRYILLTSGKEEILTWVYPRLHKFVHYSRNDRSGWVRGCRSRKW